MKPVFSNQRDRITFRIVVETYLKTGTPVSSNSVVKKMQVPVSSATVRNIMGRLESKGYLSQPHTSAGRIPTDQGLRFYVNTLLEEAMVPGKMFNWPDADADLDKGDFNSLFVQASQMLSEYSDNLGFVISPNVTKINFRHIRMIKLSEEKVLIILVTTVNLPLTEVLRTDSVFTQNELDRACRYINENFSGKNLSFVHDYLHKELPKYRIEFESILKKLTELLSQYFRQEEEKDQIFLRGASKLLEKPELFEMARLKSLFKNFEEKARLARLLSDFISLDRVKVLIGSEMEMPEAADCSLILSHYGDDTHVLGSLGIIGPKRIPYKTIIPLVDYVAKSLSRKICTLS